MGLELNFQEGQTPLNEEEKEGLLVKSISTREELDEHEQLNIERAVEWTIRSKFKAAEILSENFIKKLHLKMFDKVWRWAGKFRKTNKNIGINWIYIEAELKILLDDTRFWLEHKSYPEDEIAIRFKHRLVSIHCFSNGNGRHSRIMAEIIIESIFKRELFTWNFKTMTKANEVRKSYISALKQADLGNIAPLIEFAHN